MAEEAGEYWEAAVKKLRSQNEEPLTLTSFGTLINNHHERRILQWMTEGNYQRVSLKHHSCRLASSRN